MKIARVLFKFSFFYTFYYSLCYIYYPSLLIFITSLSSLLFTLHFSILFIMPLCSIKYIYTHTHTHTYVCVIKKLGFLRFRLIPQGFHLDRTINETSHPRLCLLKHWQQLMPKKYVDWSLWGMSCASLTSFSEGCLANKSLETSFTVKGGVLILQVFFTSINSCHSANLINTFVLIHSLDHTSHNISETFHINFMIVNAITYSKALPKRFCLESITTQLAKEDGLT